MYSVILLYTIIIIIIRKNARLSVSSLIQHDRECCADVYIIIYTYMQIPL